MKNIAILLLLSLVAFGSFAQNGKYQLPERNTPVIKKEKLNAVKTVNDLSPLLWSNLSFAMNERYWLDHRRENIFPQPSNYIYPQENYKQVLEVVYVEIATTSNGKTLSAKSTSDKLTAEQKNLLNTADLGTDIAVTLMYKYKNQKRDDFGARDGVVKGSTVVTVVPDVEAEFPGGHKQLSNYIVENIMSKTADAKMAENATVAIVKFTVTEQGDLVNAKLERSTNDKTLDKLIQDALSKMPKWKPAQNAQGIKVKQDFSIPFGAGC